jgi:hypothetical protein
MYSKSTSIQGGAVNHGLFFAGPPPTPLGAVSSKISKKLMVGITNDGINVVAGMSGPPVTMEMACRQITTQSLVEM